MSETYQIILNQQVITLSLWKAYPEQQMTCYSAFFTRIAMCRSVDLFVWDKVREGQRAGKYSLMVNGPWQRGSIRADRDTIEACEALVNAQLHQIVQAASDFQEIPQSEWERLKAEGYR